MLDDISQGSQHIQKRWGFGSILGCIDRVLLRHRAWWDVTSLTNEIQQGLMKVLLIVFSDESDEVNNVYVSSYLPYRVREI